MTLLLMSSLVANDIVVCHSDGCQNPSWFSLKENGQRNILVISHWLLVVSKIRTPDPITKIKELGDLSRKV